MIIKYYISKQNLSMYSFIVYAWLPHKYEYYYKFNVP